MKRSSVLGIIVLAGVVGWGWQSLQADQAQAPAAPAGQGQPPAAGRGPAPGVGAIQKITNNVFWIPGAGGNSTVFVAANGVVLVDTKLANNGQAILDQIKSVTDKPITHIINTHTHGDHNGSNVFFPANVEIVAHQNTVANMKKMEAFQQPANAHGLPDRNFTDRMTLLSGNDSVDLFYFGAAHTNGDTFVLFRNARVLAAGDAFANTAQPNIDLANGGSGIAYSETIGKAASTIRNIDTIVGGHAPGLLKPTDLPDYAEFLKLLVDHARQSMKMGRTPEQAMMDLQANLPAKFKSYGLGPGRGGPGGVFVTLYEELKQRQ
jgi:glyoxylase-like metal-dependent hydrolase (beta-lactamase superfamily II)